MFESGFFSPYATCHAPGGPNDQAFFPAPFHWLYGAVGAAGRGLGVDEFLFLGLANGLGVLVYLLAVYHFFRLVIAGRSHLAFVLFALTGGLGGVLFVLAGIAGLWDAPRFDVFFERFSMYELVEGPYLMPTLLAPRLYYTLSLACCFGAMSAFIRAIQVRCLRHEAWAGFLLLLGTLVNVRFGALAWAVIALYLACDSQRRGRARLREAVTLAAPVVIGVLASWAAMSRNPAFAENTSVLVRESMWLTAFVSAAIFPILLFPVAFRALLPSMTGWQRVLAFSGLGYLAAFALLFAAYQVYFGNFWNAGDAAAANRISDWALFGAMAGAGWGYIKRATGTPMRRGDASTVWMALWFLGCVAIGVSAFGQGWFIRLTPQRLMVFAAVPAAALSAYVLEVLAARRRRLARAAVVAMVGCGVVSIFVATLFFQAPLMREPGQSPFDRLHPEVISRADMDLMEGIGSGVVLAPFLYSDILGLRAGLRVLGGAGGADLSDRMSTEIQGDVDAFFAGALRGEDAEAFLRAWCVEYVFCPDARPVPAGARDLLDGMAVLSAVQRTGAGAVYRVGGS